MSLWDKLRYIVSGEAENLDDPDALLMQAQREMREVHNRNRERAVQAFTERNNLEAAVQEAARRRDNALLRAEASEGRGESREAELCRMEAEEYDRTVAALSAALEAAGRAAEGVKADVKREEERIRRKTAEALAIRAQWKATQVQRSLLASLVEVNVATEQDAGQSPQVLQMRHARNRRLVIDALAQRNNLQAMLDDTEKRVHLLQEKAALAGRRGDDDLEHELLREMEQYEATLAGTREALAKASDVTERAVTLIREEEERLRAMGVEPVDLADGVTVEDAVRDARAEGLPDWAVPLMLALALAVIAALIALLSGKPAASIRRT